MPYGSLRKSVERQLFQSVPGAYKSCTQCNGKYRENRSNIIGFTRTSPGWNILTYYTAHIMFHFLFRFRYFFFTRTNFHDAKENSADIIKMESECVTNIYDSRYKRVLFGFYLHPSGTWSLSSPKKPESFNIMEHFFTFSYGRDSYKVDKGRPGAVSHQRHSLGIAAERRQILPEPM